MPTGFPRGDGPLIVSVDGSMDFDRDGPVAERKAAFAAVTNSGRYLVGWTDECPNPEIAEVQAVRMGLRFRQPSQPILVLTDLQNIIPRIEKMRTDEDPIWDPKIDREMRQALRYSDVRVQWFGPSGSKSQMPPDRAMIAAHTLAWLARRFVRDGIDPADPRVRAWTLQKAADPHRSKTLLATSYNRRFKTILEMRARVRELHRPTEKAVDGATGLCVRSATGSGRPRIRMPRRCCSSAPRGGF
jgi:hypothetical protein